MCAIMKQFSSTTMNNDNLCVLCIRILSFKSCDNYTVIYITITCIVLYELKGCLTYKYIDWIIGIARLIVSELAKYAPVQL